jgi:tetratricopeptide (TPR) repeat protein
MKTTTAAIPDQDEIRDQLHRILDSSGFKSSARLVCLLKFLVNEVLAGNGESLSEYRVGTEALSLAQNFDPSTKSLVRSHAARLRKALASYYNCEGKNDDILISMPATGYHVVFLRLGSTIIQRKPAARLPLLTIAEFHGIGLKGALSTLPSSVTEEMLLRFARAAHLRVARHSKDTATSPPDFQLEGSIEQRGSLILIRSRLLEGSSGVQIWGRRHEFHATKWNPTAFEEQIVEAISVEVGADFGSIDRHLLRKTSKSKREGPSLQSALLKLKACELGCSEKSFNAAESALKKFLKVSPANPDAHAAMGLLLILSHMEYHHFADSFPEAALEHFAIAQAGAPRNPYLIYGRCLALLAQQKYDALADLSDEFLSDPNFAPGPAALICMLLAYAQKATPRSRSFLVAHINQNPDHPRLLHSALALEKLILGDHASALHEMKQAYNPENWFGPSIILAIHHADGRQSDAEAERSKLRRLAPGFALHGRKVLGRSLHPNFVNLIMLPHTHSV